MRRIFSWQSDVRQNYGRIYSSTDLAKIRDGLHYALVGLNRFLRGGHPLAVKETMLIGWAGGPTGASTLAAFSAAAVSAAAKTDAYTWASYGYCDRFRQWMQLHRPGKCLRPRPIAADLVLDKHSDSGVLTTED